MPELKTAIQLRGLRQPFRRALETAGRLGAEAVEIDARGELRPRELSQTARRQIRKMLADMGLAVSALAFPTRRGYDVLDELEARVAATKEAMQLAFDLGAAVVVNRVGRIGQPEDAAGSLLVEVLTDLGHFGQQVGARLAMATGGESSDDAARLLDALPEGSLAVDLDPGAVVKNGFSPLEAVQSLGPHILHVHATDGVREVAEGRGLNVPLGRGSADLPAVLGGLEEHDYRGYFTVTSTAAEDPIQELANALEFLKSL